MAKIPRSTEIDPLLGISAEDVERKAAGDIALMDDPIYTSYKWSIWRLRLPEEIARESQGGEWEKVATKIGPLDEDWALANLGGGTFEFRGYFDEGDGNGRIMRRRPIIALAGPRKNFAAPPPAPVTPPVVTGAVTSNGSLSRAERILIRMIREQNVRLERIEAARSIVPAATPVTELITGLQALDTLRGRQTAPVNPDREAVAAMIEMLEKGQEIGSRQGTTVVDGKTDYVGLAQALTPLAEKLVSAFAARRAPRPATGSVEQLAPGSPPALAEPEPQLGIDDIRWIAVGDALTRAVAEGDDPESFATYLERQLTSVQLAIARGMTVEQVLGMLLRFEPDSQVLKSEAAGHFITAVLAVLNTPAEA